MDNSKNIAEINFDAIVIGGGAAGLMCAYQLGKRKLKVLLIEKNKTFGRKILISGGGRCNFTNKYLTNKNFQSTNLNFCKAALKEYPAREFIKLVEANNIPFFEKKLGQLFCQKSAKDILNMLIRLCNETQNVSFLLNNEISSPDQVIKDEKDEQNIYHVITDKRYVTSNLIISSGGLSIPNIGAGPIGYQIAKKFGLKIVDTYPALVPFKSCSLQLEKTKSISGLSIPCRVSIGKKSFEENILFTHRGLSGPAILQISLYWEKNTSISINFLPNINLQDYFSENNNLSIGKALKNKLPNNFVDTWLKTIYISPDQLINQISKKSLIKIKEHLQSFSYTPEQTEGMRKAEVTKGGICTSELNNKTMESKKNKGLFFIGEVIDVTGELGGFNFQWAWSSSYSCAKYINMPR